MRSLLLSLVASRRALSRHRPRPCGVPRDRRRSQIIVYGRVVTCGRMDRRTAGASTPSSRRGRRRISKADPARRHVPRAGRPDRPLRNVMVGAPEFQRRRRSVLFLNAQGPAVASRVRPEPGRVPRARRLRGPAAARWCRRSLMARGDAPETVTRGARGRAAAAARAVRRPVRTVLAQQGGAPMRRLAALLADRAALRGVAARCRRGIPEARHARRQREPSRCKWEDCRSATSSPTRRARRDRARSSSDAVTRAFATWTAVRDARVSSEFVGFTRRNPVAGDGATVIGFQNRPDLDRTLGATSFLVDTTTGEIVESDIFFNSAFPWSVAAQRARPTATTSSRSRCTRSATCTGSAHSALGETELRAGGRRVLGAESVMFPIAFSAGNIDGSHAEGRTTSPASPTSIRQPRVRARDRQHQRQGHQERPRRARRARRRVQPADRQAGRRLHARARTARS